MLSEIIYKRTYSRDGEKFEDTIDRVCKGLKGLGWTDKSSLNDLKQVMLNREALVSGRSLWQLGAPRFTGDSLQSCWCVKVNTLDSLLFCFNELMLGGGVGFNIQAEHVYELPVVKNRITVSCVNNNDCGYIVPDNREGWIRLLEILLDAVFNGDSSGGFSYSVSCVRRAGEKINGFGGTASGPDALVLGISRIAKILAARVGNKLRPIDCLDMFNIIGKIVVSGNVRRSSEIAIGDPCDKLFINSKVGDYPSWRAMSNNAVACDDIADFCGWETFDSDPLGFVNIKNMKRYGRLVDGVDYRWDGNIIGCNPCGEISLEDSEPCNLAEIFLPNVPSGKLPFISKLLLRACKLITCAEFGDSVTRSVVSRNRRIGIGLAGICQVDIDWKLLDRVYRELEIEDAKVSGELGIPTSVKLTTVKPGGTMCLLAGVTPGMTSLPEYVNRRVRFSESDELLDKLAWAGYDIETDVTNSGVKVVSFPVHYPGSRAYGNVIESLEMQKKLQTHWADNCVSCTHMYQDSEIGSIKQWLGVWYNEAVKTTCFMPAGCGDYKQLPITAIDKCEYQDMLGRVKQVAVGDGDVVGDGCDSGGCPVR